MTRPSFIALNVNLSTKTEISLSDDELIEYLDSASEITLVKKVF